MAGQPGDSSLDLSHLTEVEQSKILQVLQRDLDLRLLDEGRVRSEVTANPLPPRPPSSPGPGWSSSSSLCCRVLQETETDQRRLRSMSGAWFTEERNKRHHTWSGSALVNVSLRHKKTKSRGPSVRPSSCRREGVPSDPFLWLLL